MESKHQHHFIDFLFPLTLFLLFASLSVIIILLATNIYRDTTSNSYYNDNTRLSLAYVSEKVHQNNGAQRIHLDTIEGTDVLVIHHPGETDNYSTYIYFKDGYLKELFLKDGLSPDLNFGRNISQVSSFTIQQVSPSLLSFHCTDQQNRSFRTFIGLKCN